MKFFSLLFKSTLLVGGITVSLLAALPAAAQVGMSPLFLEIEAVRGRSQGVVTLINSSDEPIRARVYSEPFTYEQNGFVSLQEDADDLSPYLQFSPREVVIAPKSTQRVRLLGLFPPSLQEGEYRAAIFAESLFDGSTEESSAVINARIGTTVYMRQGELSAALSMDPSGLSVTSDRQSIELIITNQGQATARPQVAWMLVGNADGAEIASGKEDMRTVVAEGDRKFPIALPDILPTGSYTLSGELVWTTLEDSYSQPFELPLMVP